MTFSRSLVLRWYDAKSCRRGNNGRPCSAYWQVLEDAKAVAEHLRVFM
jgi:hypothetical protein